MTSSKVFLRFYQLRDILEIVFLQFLKISSLKSFPEVFW